MKALSDAAGAAKDSYEYDAFGAVQSHDGTTENSYRYAGEYFDDAIVVQFNRERWYDAKSGRFTSLDSFKGKAKLPLSLNKYIYVSADPVAQKDPSGLTNLLEEEVVLSEVTEGSTVVTAELSATASGQAANAAGTAAEGAVQNAIRNCLKPGVEFKKLLKGDAIFTSGNLRAFPDFLFKVGDKITYLEVKTKLPLKSAKEAFKRGAKQLQAAIDNNSNIVGLSFNKLGDLAFKNRTANLLGALSGDTGMVKMVNGFLDLSSYLGEFVLDNCL